MSIPVVAMSNLLAPAGEGPVVVKMDWWGSDYDIVGATVIRYSFGVGLFHSFLHAGLSRRFP